MATLSTYEAKAHLSRVIGHVIETGEAVTITRNRKPVVDIVPHVEPADPLKQASVLQGARFVGDPCGSVPESDWPEELR